MAATELIKSVFNGNTNLKMYYRFEETSGTSVTDSSGNSNTGTASRSNILNNSAGKFGNRAVFAAASSDLISLTTNANLQPTGNFTVGVWVNTTQSVTGGYNVGFLSNYGFNGSTESGYQLRVGATNRPAFYHIAAGIVLVGDSTINDGAWHLLVATWNGTTLRLYTDTAVVSQATTTALSYPITTYPRLGVISNDGTAPGDTNNYLNGSLDEAFIFNGIALTAEQVKELYEGRILGEFWPQSNLQGLYHLTAGVSDFSENAKNLTNANSVTFSVQGADFGSSDANKTLRTTDPLAYTGSSYSLRAKVKINTAPGVGTLYDLMSIEEATNDTRLDFVYYNPAGTRQLIYSRTRINVAGSSATVNMDIGTSLFYDLVLTYDATNVIGYLNGVEIGRVAASGNGSASTTAGMILGGQFNDLNANNGLMTVREAACFNKVLTPFEIRQRYGVSTGKWQ